MKNNEIINYLNDLNFKKINSDREFNNYLISIIGKEDTIKFKKFINTRADNGSNDNKSFYDFKNETLEKSLAIASAFEYDLIYDILLNLLNKSVFFGNEILDVGCDCGITTCFLGKHFPDKHFTGIDICENAIRNANILKNRLKLENVDFIVSPLSDLNKKYDTVISNRTLHENDSFFTFHTYEEDEIIINKCCESFKKHLNDLKNTISDSGYLLSFERSYTPFIAYSWLYSCLSSGMNIQEETFSFFVSKEMNEDSHFFSVVFQNNNDIQKINYNEKVKDIFKPFYLDSTKWIEWAGKFALFLFKEKCILKYEIYNKTNFVGVLSLYSLEEDKYIIYEMNLNGNWEYLLFKKEMKDKLIEHIKNEILRLTQSGLNAFQK